MTPANTNPALPTDARITACTLDCPDSCSLLVHVDAAGKPVIEAAPDRAGNSFTNGFICSKVKRFERHSHGDHRLRTPLVRKGSKGSGSQSAAFEALSWDQALGRVVGAIRTTLERSGGEAILPLSYGGSNGMISQDTTDSLLFSRLGASRLERTVCAAPSTAAAAGLYGKMAGVALEDYGHSDLVVVWGANPSATGIHLIPKLREAQARGGKLVVIDPRRTPLARQADLALQPQPGTDLALALCISRELFARGQADRQFLARYCSSVETFEERCREWSIERAARVCSLEPAAIERFLELYVEATAAVIRCGWGVERNRNGASAIAAILAIPAVAGKFGVRGGGYTMSNGGAWRDAGLRSVAAASQTRRINQNLVGRALLEAQDPPIELLFVYNHNPLMTLPQQELVRRGLQRDDLFVVVFDQVMTDTAHHADVVLPATTFLEHQDLAKSYGRLAIHRTEPVMPAVGEARSNVEVFAELLRRLELDEAGDPLDAPSLSEHILGEREAQLDAELELHPPSGATPIQFVDAMPLTASGRVELVPETMDAAHPQGLYSFLENPHDDPRFPLTLISPATRGRISSTFGQLDVSLARVGLHPRDAAARALRGAPEERVRVWNELGEVHCGVRIDTNLRPGVAELPKGLWSQNTLNGNTSNALVPDTLTDVGGGACFNDARVEVALLQ